MRIKNIKVQACDMYYQICEICEGGAYPSYMINVEGKWKNIFICRSCLKEKLLLKDSDIELIEKSFNSGRDKGEYIDKSWFLDDNKREVLKVFMDMEKEDYELLRDDRLLKVHKFYEELKRGFQLTSNEEINKYLRFYDNEYDLVMTLRSILMREREDVSKFIRDMYINSRVRKLTIRQIHALMKDRRFSFLDDNLEIFWETVDLVLENYLEVLDNKTYGIIEDVGKKGYFTDKQYACLQGYFKNIMDNGGNDNEEEDLFWSGRWRFAD